MVKTCVLNVYEAKHNYDVINLLRLRLDSVSYYCILYSTNYSLNIGTK